MSRTARSGWVRVTDKRVQILLFLSAMLAGLTGLISGDRAVEPRHVEQTVSVASAIVKAAPAAVREAQAVSALTIPATAAPVAVRAFYPAASVALPGRAPVDERRLE